MAALFSACAWLGIDLLILEQAGSFLAHFMLCGLLGLVIFPLARSWSWALLSALPAVLGAIQIAPLYMATESWRPAGASAPSAIKLLLANIHTPNQRRAEILEIIRAEAPDVLLIVEANKIWAEELESLADILPHGHVHLRRDNFGIALYSRLPFEQVESRPLKDWQPPTIVATLKLDGKPLTVVATHPVPPAGRYNLELRDAQLESLAELAATRERLVLGGDLNVTPWSGRFRGMLEKGGLRDTRMGTGIVPTWPRHLPFLFIPIDHFLVKGDLRASGLRAVDLPGSDHNGLVVMIENGI